jgi:DNA-binding HxlR family transcriptional regulator
LPAQPPSASARLLVRQARPVRFDAFRKLVALACGKSSLTGISQKMLTQHLKELQRHGVVHRESYHEVPPRAEYSMTPASEELLEALEPLGDWATKHIDLICAAEAG